LGYSKPNTTFGIRVSPKVKKGKYEVEENQFLNVGWGVHVDTLIKFLTDKNVSFKITDE